jgi:hypothetical protein
VLPWLYSFILCFVMLNCSQINFHHIPPYYDGAAHAAAGRISGSASKESGEAVQCARHALAGLVRHAPTAFSFFLVLKVKDKEGAAQTAAEVHADFAADRRTRSTSAAPTTERRRRGCSGRAARREAV